MNLKDASIEQTDNCHPLFRNAPSSVAFKKLRKRLLRQMREALGDFSMVEPQAKWLICLSGGKDSYALLALLADLKWRGLLPVELLACNLDQGQPGFPKHILPEFLEQTGIPFHIETKDTYSIVKEKIPEGGTTCSLCSRLRRGHLYRIAHEENCTHIVLGHHMDDLLETFFLNLFHGGRLATMSPKLRNDNGDLIVLRPLIYAYEGDLERFAQALKFPIIPCNLCGSQKNLQRVIVREILDTWERQTPGRKSIMAKALSNVSPSHLLDTELFDFSQLDGLAITSKV
ncbi:MAG: tRNA 2-thiocytidine(32) synthetase TtcA [bacterium]|nr:tRNA 2-thiocytidine(32) synthetase TtcA [bacterium]